MYSKIKNKISTIVLLLCLLVSPLNIQAKTKDITASDSNYTKDIPRITKAGNYIVYCDTVLGNLRVGFKAPKSGKYTFKFSNLASGNNVAMRSVVELDHLYKKKYIKQAPIEAQYLDTVDHKSAVITCKMKKGAVLYPTILSPMLLEDGLLVSCTYDLKIKYAK